jgi:hypothetical protein
MGHSSPRSGFVFSARGGGGDVGRLHVTLSAPRCITGRVSKTAPDVAICCLRLSTVSGGIFCIASNFVRPFPTVLGFSGGDSGSAGCREPKRKKMEHQAVCIVHKLFSSTLTMRHGLPAPHSYQNGLPRRLSFWLASLRSNFFLGGHCAAGIRVLPARFQGS